MAEEYAVSGWFRWIPDILVKESTGFLLFNLRQNEERGSGIAGTLGDRDLECLFLYGGHDEGSVLFNTYSTLGNGNHGNPLLSKVLPAPNFVWSFIYFGYSMSLSEGYGVLLAPGSVMNAKLLFITNRLEKRRSRISSINWLHRYFCSWATSLNNLASMGSWLTCRCSLVQGHLGKD
jgi:hypothetical protein